MGNREPVSLCVWINKISGIPTKNPKEKLINLYKYFVRLYREPLTYRKAFCVDLTELARMEVQKR